METRRGILIEIDPETLTWRDTLRDLAAGMLSLAIFAVAGAVAQGSSVPVSGWALAHEDLANVVVELDGVQVTTLPVNGARPDVCVVYPGYQGCPLVGFSGSVSLASLDTCAHLMRVVAVTSSGVRTVLGERAVKR